VASLNLAFDAETEELAAALADAARHEHTLAADANTRAHMRGGNVSVKPTHNTRTTRRRR